MSERTVTTTQRADLDAAHSPHALVAFLKVEHDNLSTPIRVVADNVDYIWGGETWKGIVFDAKPATDDENATFTEITVQNIDREIGRALEKAITPAKIALYLISTADFDISVGPRVESVTPSPIYALQEFSLRSVSVDVLQVKARAALRDYATEPWPYIRATEDICPGLWW